MEKFKLEKSRKEFIRETSKIVHAWNVHLEMFSLPQPIEILGSFCFSDLITFVRLSMA